MRNVVLKKNIVKKNILFHLTCNYATADDKNNNSIRIRMKYSHVIIHTPYYHWLKKWYIMCRNRTGFRYGITLRDLSAGLKVRSDHTSLL